MILTKLWTQLELHALTQAIRSYALLLDSYYACTQMDLKSRLYHSYVCIAGVNVVSVFTLQYNPPLVSCSEIVTKNLVQIHPD